MVACGTLGLGSCVGKDRRPSKGPGSIGRHGVVGAAPPYDWGRRALLACVSWLARQFSAAACTTHVSSGPVRGDAPGRRRLPVGKLALAGTLVLKHGGPRSLSYALYKRDDGSALYAFWSWC